MCDLSRIVQLAGALRAELAGFELNAVDGEAAARLAEELAALEKVCGAARLLAGARAVRCQAFVERGFRDGAAWMAAKTGSTGHQARRELAAAARLTAMPETRDAALAGAISVSQAAEIARAEAATPGIEKTLLPVARSGDLTQTRESCRREELRRTPVDEQRRRQVQARSFRHWTDQGGMTCFEGRLPPETGVALVNRLRNCATGHYRRIRKTAGTWEQSMADALVELTSVAPGRKRSANTELVVVCDLNAYRRGHTHSGEICQIVDGGPIPVEIARQLAEDAFLKAVIHDGVNVHTVKHFGRRYTAELKTALDLGAAPDFEGRRCARCGSRWGLQYDHINPVNNHGPTSFDNIQALCWGHHHIKTDHDRRAGLLGPKTRAGPAP